MRALDQDDPELQRAFVRRTNPRPAARSGRILMLLGQVLQRVDRPALLLDDFFDMVMSEDTIIALDQRLFETLFKETPALQQRIPEWVAEIDRHLPFAGDGAQRLARRAKPTAACVGAYDRSSSAVTWIM